MEMSQYFRKNWLGKGLNKYYLAQLLLYKFRENVHYTKYFLPKGRAEEDTLHKDKKVEGFNC
jgi:hypothetical protein